MPIFAFLFVLFLAITILGDLAVMWIFKRLRTSGGNDICIRQRKNSELLLPTITRLLWKIKHSCLMAKNRGREKLCISPVQLFPEYFMVERMAKTDSRISQVFCARIRKERGERKRPAVFKRRKCDSWSVQFACMNEWKLHIQRAGLMRRFVMKKDNGVPLKSSKQGLEICSWHHCLHFINVV